MPNILTVTAEQPDELLNAGAYGAASIIRVQSSATEAGAFADISGTGSTPTLPLVAGTRSYTAYDPNGTVSTWYRTRFENAGGTRVSDWQAAFQVGEEAGYLIGWWDVQQELGSTLTNGDKESVLEKIRQVTTAIETYTGRWFVPRPLSGTTTYTFHSNSGLTFRMPKGIRSITTLQYATSGQPETGGVYSTASAVDYYLDPTSGDRSPGWPATAIRLRRETSSRFYDATFGIKVTGAFGWASVPADIQGIALRAVVRRYIGKGGGGVSVAVGPEGTEFLLPDMSGSDRATLSMYRDVGSLVGS